MFVICIIKFYHIPHCAKVDKTIKRAVENGIICVTRCIVVKSRAVSRPFMSIPKVAKYGSPPQQAVITACYYVIVAIHDVQ